MKYQIKNYYSLILNISLLCLSIPAILAYPCIRVPPFNSLS